MAARLERRRGNSRRQRLSCVAAAGGGSPVSSSLACSSSHPVPDRRQSMVARRPIATQVLRAAVRAERGPRHLQARPRRPAHAGSQQPCHRRSASTPISSPSYAMIQVALDFVRQRRRLPHRRARRPASKARSSTARVVWGDVSKLLPPPSDKPFALPNIVLDVADSRSACKRLSGRLASRLPEAAT